MGDFGSWTDTERAINQELARRQEKEGAVIRCPKCDGTWFEEARFNQYLADHSVVVGQQVPTKPATIPFILLRCVNCDTKLEPRLENISRDIASKGYDNFLDTAEGKLDKRKEEGKEVIPTVKV